MSTYSPHDVVFTRGEGSWLFDTNGKRYLDGLTGLAVCGLGHAHPAVTRAIQSQAGELLHCSNHFRIARQEALAEKLCAVSGMENAFFCNSGAEANEAAIKLARLYGNKHQNIDKPSIIVMEGAFHGRTMATLSATGNRKIQAGFEPLVAGFVRAPFNDLEAIRTIGRNNNSVVAILVEPVQGEGGICVPDDGYLRELKAICEQHDWLLMLDEVQSGNGRSGQYFAYQHEGIVPDVVTTAKGLGNGVPIGACLAQGVAGEVLTVGSHGTTFGGNPLSAATALAVLDSIEKEGLSARAAELSQRIQTKFSSLLNDGLITELRAKGLMIGLNLGKPCTELVAEGLKNGVVINVTAESILRMLPPLNMSDSEADQLVDHVSELILSFHSKQS
ncbi:MAG: aspartate aminotransferase family protein [Pseudomonadales bacterium]